MDESVNKTMNKDEDEDKTPCDRDRDYLLEVANKLVNQENLIAKYEKAFNELSAVLQEKTYLITNKATGEKHIGDLDEIFSIMIHYFKSYPTLEGFFDVIRIEKLKPETAAILYGQQKNIPK